jgi:hypothetical protein
MANKKNIVIALILMAIVAGISFAASIKTGEYSDTSGSDGVTFRFYADGTVKVCVGYSVKGSGRYSTSGDRLIINFSQIIDEGRYLSNKTWSYIIDGDDSFAGNGQYWVRIGN